MDYWIVEHFWADESHSPTTYYVMADGCPTQAQVIEQCGIDFEEGEHLYVSEMPIRYIEEKAHAN